MVCHMSSAELIGISCFSLARAFSIWRHVAPSFRIMEILSVNIEKQLLKSCQSKHQGEHWRLESESDSDSNFIFQFTYNLEIYFYGEWIKKRAFDIAERFYVTSFWIDANSSRFHMRNSKTQLSLLLAQKNYTLSKILMWSLPCLVWNEIPGFLTLAKSCVLYF